MKGIINKNKMIRNFLGKSRKKNLNRNRLNRNNVVCVWRWMIYWDAQLVSKLIIARLNAKNLIGRDINWIVRNFRRKWKTKKIRINEDQLKNLIF
jgi:RIO-like serine/threonine protein kinase